MSRIGQVVDSSDSRMNLFKEGGNDTNSRTNLFKEGEMIRVTNAQLKLKNVMGSNYHKAQ
ncbi:hypothetical protein Gotur_035871 [Gossypium turneri]